MKRSTYFVGLYTNELYTPDEYAAEAGALLMVVQSILQSAAGVRSLTRGADVTKCHTEVEIAQDERGLNASCVVEFESPARVTLDKTKLSALLKSECARLDGKWPRITLSKRAVDSAH